MSLYKRLIAIYRIKHAFKDHLLTISTNQENRFIRKTNAIPMICVSNMIHRQIKTKSNTAIGRFALCVSSTAILNKSAIQWNHSCISNHKAAKSKEYCESIAQFAQREWQFSHSI